MPKKATILVVDDSAQALTALEELLSVLNLRVVTARSGAEALRFLLREEFAAILLDVEMSSGMDGFETARLIRGRSQCDHVPIIFLSSGVWSESLASQAYQLKALDYLLSPPNPEVLLAKVEVILALHARRQAGEEEQRNLDEAQRASRSGNWIWNPINGVVWWSSWMARICGRDRAGFAGTLEAHLETVHAEDLPLVRAFLNEAARSGKRFEFECRLRRTDGTTCRVMVRGESMNPGRVVATVIDLSPLAPRELVMIKWGPRGAGKPGTSSPRPSPPAAGGDGERRRQSAGSRQLKNVAKKSGFA
jgi:CheY-like chemotaxis protein